MEPDEKNKSSLWYVLLAIPFVALLWIPFYSSGTPRLWGFPYFYWYQFAWVIISAIITALAYRATR